MSGTTKHSRAHPSPPCSKASGPRHWALKDAKARFGELVRLAQSEGPQHVVVHGGDHVVVVAAEEFRRLQGKRTGQVLIDALRALPSRKMEMDPARGPMPVRDASR